MLQVAHKEDGMTLVVFVGLMYMAFRVARLNATGR